ncbi:NmrA domain-containing protein [Mycena sanguinolenta]|uniref:NmrA domain-containing protein n=1 Tax=Mycena sanguinolenta TaxID=230812 RepID=A0A8H6Y4S6_9AGAR|nr:NmrA domain-containing protein [Mycena sanguinolenta]
MFSWSPISGNIWTGKGQSTPLFADVVGKELSEGKMLIDAAKVASVKGTIWSGLAHANKISGGNYSLVGHWGGKAQVSEYGRASGVPFFDVQAGFYASNFLGNSSLFVKEPNGTYVLPWLVRPTTVVPLIDMDNDYGLYRRHHGRGDRFPKVPAYAVVSLVNTQPLQVTGKKIVFKQITTEDATNNFIASGIPPATAADLVEGMQFWDKFGYYGGRASNREGLAQPTRTFISFAQGVDWSKILVLSRLMF